MKPRSALALLISVMLMGCASVAASNQETAMTTTPIESRPLWSIDDHFYLAATIWAEARGEGPEGMRVVAHVIRNRVNANRPKSFGKGFKGVTTHPWQFSCWNKGDPNRAKLDRAYLSHKLTGLDRERWQEAQKIATEVLNGEPDLTLGADHYHTTAVNPKWAKAVDKKGKPILRKLAQVGSHIFYKS